MQQMRTTIRQLVCWPVVIDLKAQDLLVKLHGPLQVLYDEAYVLEAVYLQFLCAQGSVATLQSCVSRSSVHKLTLLRRRCCWRCRSCCRGCIDRERAGPRLMVHPCAGYACWPWRARPTDGRWPVQRALRHEMCHVPILVATS